MTRVAAFLWIATGSACFADSIAAPRAYVTASPGGRFYFKAIPPSVNGRNAPRGEVYEVIAEGPDRLSWTVSGWYASSAYLSDDGETVVRLGDWSFAGPPDDRVGVAFYRRGRLLKQYRVKELVRDPATAPRSVSFSHYLRHVGGFGGGPGRFKLTTCDGVEHDFDVQTGAVVSRQGRGAPQTD